MDFGRIKGKLTRGVRGETRARLRCPIYKVGVQASDLKTVIRRLQENMSSKLLFLSQGYYAHFYRDMELLIVFRDKVFHVSTDPTTLGEAIEHGKTLGIAARQLDFSPCRVEEETYRWK